MTYQGMALYPFILLKRRELATDKVIMNHETIHLRQQTEMLLIFFYILYGLNYCSNRLRYKDHDSAYRNIVFEREAYSNEKDLEYLKKRKLFNWVRYL
ncbi:MAG: hypothetical protein H7X71_03070 [Chitinophagales bacterium]|nr:hypothetical protein [Chitinophagales bacterium]